MKHETPKSLGERIRSIRGSLTQVEFAHILRIKQAMISRYERNKETPSPRILLRMAQYSGTSVEWLLTGEESSPTYPSKSGVELAGKVPSHLTSDKLVDLAAKPLDYIDDPETSEFTDMMKDLFSNREMMKLVLKYYRYLKFNEPADK